MAKASSELHRYAVIGAQSHLETLQTEVASILRAFPELARGRASTVTSDRRATSAWSNGTAPPKRSRPKMTAAQRKAVSARMAKYWAARRKQNAGTRGAAKAAKATTA
jgi:hypothetical protein